MTTLRFPMQLDHSGRLATNSTEEQKDRSRVLFTIGTALGERVMRPDFGADTMWAFFMAGEDLEEGMKLAVATMFQKHLPHLELYWVTPTLTKDYDGSVAYIDLEWGYKASPTEPVSTTVNVSGLTQQMAVS